MNFERLSKLRVAAQRSHLPPTLLDKLDEQEFAGILGLVGGYSPEQIAVLHKVSKREVYYWLARAKQRLGVNSNRELINFVLSWIAPR